MKAGFMIASTEGDKLREQKLAKSDAAGSCILELTAEKFQTIDGFGGCFNELGYLALEKTSEEKKQQVLEHLFGKDESHFTYCRLPIGASDYAARWYSYNESDGDFEMNDFSIDPDHENLIPYVKAAERYSGPLTLFASPWSPPTWMKSPKAYNYGTLRWEEPVLKAYALYFEKYIQAYQKEGIKIHQVHVQNEPISDQKFPSCVWTGKQLKEFIRDYLGPQLKDSDTELWLGTLNGPYDDYGDHNWQITQYHNYANEVLADQKARSYIKGVGFQWGGKHAIAQTHVAYPEMKLIQTENECGDGKNSWEYAEYVFHLMWLYFQNGVSAYTYWNMVLEEGGRSTWGWEQNSLITIGKDGVVSYQPEYYLMRHFSAYIMPGAIRRGLKGEFAATALAFENPDQSLIIELLNPFDEAKEVDFVHKGQIYQVKMQAHSFNTICL